MIGKILDIINNKEKYILFFLFIFFILLGALEAYFTLQIGLKLEASWTKGIFIKDDLIFKIEKDL